MSGCPSEIIVARAIGHGFVGQAQRGWGKQQGRWQGIAASREDVDDDWCGVNALIEGFATGGRDGHQAVIANAAQDLDHLPVAIIAALHFAPDRGHGRGQDPVLERGAITQRPGFARENRHIVPWVVDGLVPPEGPCMFADNRPIPSDDDPLRIGLHLDLTPGCRGRHRLFVGIEPHGAGLRHRGGHAVEAVERTGIGHELLSLCLEHLPDRLVGRIGVGVRLGIGHAFVE